MFVTHLLCSFALISGGKCIVDDLRGDLFNIYKHIAITTREITTTNVTKSDVTYYVYTKNNADNDIQLHKNNFNILSGEKIVFIIHGWMSSAQADWMIDLKDAFLQSYPKYDVVLVDWNELASHFYYVSSISIDDVGKFVAERILDLHNDHGINLDDISLVGHSLGGQMTGFIGKNIYNATGQKLPRIIALDPAGPLFSQRPSDERLNSTDAIVVQVIHTDGGTFGYKDPIGTIDFFPNGGNSQPGCIHIDITSFTNSISCDHMRATLYFIKAIQRPKEFISTKCSDWKAYEKVECNNEEMVAMGDLTTKVTGKFYLKTTENGF